MLIFTHGQILAVFHRLRRGTGLCLAVRVGASGTRCAAQSKQGQVALPSPCIG